MTTTVNKAELDLDDLLSSPMRRRFVVLYVENGGKGTAAAEAAGFGAPAQASSRMLKDAKVQEAIARHSGIVSRVAGETRDTVLDRIRNRAKGDMADYYKDVPLVDSQTGEVIVRNGAALVTQELKRMSELTREETRRIKKVSHTNNGVSIELHDPAAADRDIARLMGMEPKEHENLTAEDAASLIAAALDRMDELDAAES